MKLRGPGTYIMWSYKVEMILLQEGLWKYVEDVEDVHYGSTSVESTGRVTMTTHQPISNSDEQS